MHRSLIFRLWLAVNVIFLAVAITGTAVYVWSAVENEINQARTEVAVRQQSLRVFSSMAVRVLEADGTFTFSEEDFAMLRNLDIHNFDLFDENGVQILNINPQTEEILITPGYIAYIQTIPAGAQRLTDGEPLNLPPKTTFVRSITTEPVSRALLDEVRREGGIRTVVALQDDGTFSPAHNTMSPLSVLQGQRFGEELWTDRGSQAQRSYFAIPDLTENARALIINASLVVLVIYLATSAGCWLLLKHLIYRPLTHYSSIASLIADGEPLRMPTTGHGEMVGLARAINEMADALESRATIDSLTGLYNHRHMTGEMSRMLSIAEHTERPLSVLVADLDDFKQVNDSFGHNTGDAVLCEVAEILLEWAAGEYVCWRLGGDEFAAAMPGIPKGHARMEAARLQRMIETHGFSVPGGITHTTASLGVACSPADGSTAAELLNVADSKMYLRKDMVRTEAESDLKTA